MVHGSFFDEIIRNEALDLANTYNIDLSTRVVCHYISGKELKLPSNEYALIRGPEILLTCRIEGVKGQAFTIAPKHYEGELGDILSIDLSNLFNRGIFYATINALTKLAGLIDKSVHCSKDKPVKCSELLVQAIREKYGLSKKILHIGYHPGHVKELALFLRNNLIVTDLTSNLIWSRKYDIMIYDGLINTQLVGLTDIILLTGSSIVNNTMWDILEKAILLNKKVVIYGVSAIGGITLLRRKIPLDIEVFCPFAE